MLSSYNLLNVIFNMEWPHSDINELNNVYLKHSLKMLKINLNNFSLIFTETFLSSTILLLLLYGIILASSKEKNYPLILYSVLQISILILIFSFFLVKNNVSMLFFNNINSFFNNTIAIDNLNLYLKPYALIILFMCLCIMIPYLKIKKINFFEYILLILFSIFGILLIYVANDLLTAYLAIEIQSLSFYILSSYKKTSIFSTEAGLKYFVLGAFSSSLFLFGSSFIYGATGSTNFEDFKNLYFCFYLNINDLIKNFDFEEFIWKPAQNFQIEQKEITLFKKKSEKTFWVYNFYDFFFYDYKIAKLNIIYFGLSFIVISLFFKLALAPFHVWTPDVYEGSLSSSTFLFALLPKIAMFVLLMRIFLYSFYGLFENWRYYFVFIALLSILIGAFAGLEQRKIKSLLAYSSVNHMGYALLAFSAATFESLQTLFFYLIIYILTNLCMWSIFLSLQKKNIKLYIKKTNKELTDLNVLLKTNNTLSLSFSIVLFSVAGFPPLIGFYTKMQVFLSLTESTMYIAALFGVICSIIAAFYYIRIIKVLNFEKKKVGQLHYPIVYLNCTFISLYTFLFIYLFIDLNIILLICCKTINYA